MEPDWKKSLPRHTPPPSIWVEVRKDLDRQESANTLRAQLPSYDPPAEVWEGVSHHLGRALSFRSLWQKAGWGVAAALALALGWLLWQENPMEGRKVQVQYSQVDFSRQLEEATADQASVLAMLTNHCQQYQWVCEQPGFQSLQRELGQLEKDRKRLVSMMHPYDTDPALKNTLTRLERERAELIKQLVQKMNDF